MSNPQNTTPPTLRLGHHKMGPGVAALNSAGFQEMDQYAPYRIAALFIFVLGGVVLWVAYKLICKRSKPDEEAVAYRPLGNASGDASWEWEDDDAASEDSVDSALLINSASGTAVQ